MLPPALGIQHTKEIAKNFLLPRQQRKRFASVLALAVPQHRLEERLHALILRLTIRAKFNRAWL